jgi:transposase
MNTADTDMANHIQGQGRHQVTLLPDALDDFVTEDNPVRVVDIFVDGLRNVILMCANISAVLVEKKFQNYQASFRYYQAT